MKIIEAQESHKDAMLWLVKENYLDTQLKLNILPSIDSVEDHIQKGIDSLFEYGSGVVALNNGELEGYIMAYKANELFGKNKGSYVPLEGFAVRNNRYQ